MQQCTARQPCCDRLEDVHNTFCNMLDTRSQRDPQTVRHAAAGSLLTPQGLSPQAFLPEQTRQPLWVPQQHGTCRPCTQCGRHCKQHTPLPQPASKQHAIANSTIRYSLQANNIANNLQRSTISDAIPQLVCTCLQGRWLTSTAR